MQLYDSVRIPNPLADVWERLLELDQSWFEDAARLVIDRAETIWGAPDARSAQAPAQVTVRVGEPSCDGCGVFTLPLEWEAHPGVFRLVRGKLDVRAVNPVRTQMGLTMRSAALPGPECNPDWPAPQLAFQSAIGGFLLQIVAKVQFYAPATPAPPG